MMVMSGREGYRNIEVDGIGNIFKKTVFKREEILCSCRGVCNIRDLILDIIDTYIIYII